ncbi:hypothetical protein D3I60_07995 [Brevibacterium permense]|uniref:Zn-ribbon domain-containing OB-fold protein n=1 Tax=Brevibacterium permense TaxID=234834 RepID=UPI0021D02D55|nr:OB-fold domain-containing protein [Brevibacterium permense]MCU4297020.1 hypothetical protein [Brevibacterium permense]
MTEALRPRPALNLDNAFYFDALKEGRLVAQQCGDCAEFRHPPVPCCPRCQSFDWDVSDLSDTGELVTYTVLHHPVVPPFEAGYIVGLVEFAEGVRIVMNLEIDEADVSIGMKVEVRPHFYDPDLALPAGFAPGAETCVRSSTETTDSTDDDEKEA